MPGHSGEVEEVVEPGVVEEELVVELVDDIEEDVEEVVVEEVFVVEPG